METYVKISSISNPLIYLIYHTGKDEYQALKTFVFVCVPMGCLFSVVRPCHHTVTILHNNKHFATSQENLGIYIIIPRKILQATSKHEVVTSHLFRYIYVSEDIARWANFQLVNIGRARKILTTESTKLAVHTLVTSRLDYCNSLLAGINRGLLKRLQNVQRTAARLITRKRKYDPISDDLIELHWLPVEQRIDFKVLVLTYKAIHHQSPDYISSMLQLRTDSRHLCSTSFAPQLVQPRTHHITFADRAFSCYAPRKWNQLPPQIRNANSIGIFKRLLKSHLFELAYGQ